MSRKLATFGKGVIESFFPLEEKIFKTKDQESDRKFIPQDWADFAQLCQIKSGNKMVQFVPYYYQVELSKLMDKYTNIIVLKSRQLGITQMVVSKFLHRAALNRGYTSMSFLKNQEDSSNIARRARVMVDSLKDYLANQSDNLGYMKIKSGGELFFKNSGREGGRSYDSVSDFLYDEVAFSPNIENIYSSSSAASSLVGDDATKVSISTPNTQFGFFWDMLNQGNGNLNLIEVCQAVVNGELPPFYYWLDEEGSCKVIIHWKAHPIYCQNPDYLAYRKKQDNTSWEVIQREYNLTFINTEEAIFPAALIKTNAIGKYEEERHQNKRYYLGIDVATTGSDYTVAIVLKKVDYVYEVVAIYRKRQQTSNYNIFKIGELIETYQPEKIAIEVTGGTGQIYLEQLSKLYPGYEFQSIRTTGDSKPAMIERMMLALEKEVFVYPGNCPLVEEFLSFRRKGKKLGATAGKHDDCVMAACFALQATPFAQENGLSIEIGTFKLEDLQWH